MKKQIAWTCSTCGINIYKPKKKARPAPGIRTERKTMSNLLTAEQRAALRASAQAALENPAEAWEPNPRLVLTLLDSLDAAALGRKGGQSTSEAKRAAVRENGKKGGRPRKQADAD